MRFIPSVLLPVGVGLFILLALMPPTASAHGYVQRFSPPLPLGWYLGSAAAVVVLSFLLSHILNRSVASQRRLPTVNFDVNLLPKRTQIARRMEPLKRGFTPVVRMVSLLVFVVVLLSGFIGDQSPIHNFAPTFVWVIFWVGIPLVCACFGNVWVLLNPWKIVFTIAEFAFMRIHSNAKREAVIKYKEEWNVWPAVFLFFCFAWVENIYQDSIVPLNLASLIAAYSLTTWIGMLTFGTRDWLRFGDPFSVLFNLLSYCSILELSASTPSICETCSEYCRPQSGTCTGCISCFIRTGPGTRGFKLRIFGSGVIGNKYSSGAQTVFLLLVLATLTADGFFATSTWLSLSQRFVSHVPNVTMMGSFALFSAPILFYGLYRVAMALTPRLGGFSDSSTELGNIFAITLLPIAVSYHLAHFHYFLLMQGQSIIPLVSDPFGFGWNVFGTANYRMNAAILSPNVSWSFMVFAIVVGHVVAVYAVHKIAMRRFGEHSAVFIGLIPILALMTAYTVLSLWVMAQPMMA